jgi:hypothetical protein
MVCHLSFEGAFKSTPCRIESIVSERKSILVTSNRSNKENLISVSPIEVLSRPRKQKSADVYDRRVNLDNLVNICKESNHDLTRVATLNARSLKANLDIIKQAVACNGIHILGITETWLRESDVYV